MKDALSRSLHRPEEFEDAKVAAAVAALLSGDDSPQILLIKRVESAKDPWSGQVALPGGRMDASDASPMDTLLREVREEVGVDLREGARFLGCLPPQAPANRPKMKVLPFVVHLDGPPVVRANDEVQEHFSVPIRDLEGTERRAQVHVRGRILLALAYRVRGHPVWGFTFRVIQDLLRRLPPRG